MSEANKIMETFDEKEEEERGFYLPAIVAGSTDEDLESTIIWFETPAHYIVYAKARLFNDVPVSYEIHHTNNPEELIPQIRGYDEDVWLQHANIITSRIAQVQ